VIFWRGSKPQRNDPSSLARECRLIIKRSAKEYTHIDIEECGYIHFNNGIGFVEKKVWSGEIQRQQQPANQAIASWWNIPILAFKNMGIFILITPLDLTRKKFGARRYELTQVKCDQRKEGGWGRIDSS
jgi:hypothetical protein